MAEEAQAQNASYVEGSFRMPISTPAPLSLCWLEIIVECAGIKPAGEKPSGDKIASSVIIAHWLASPMESPQREVTPLMQIGKIHVGNRDVPTIARATGSEQQQLERALEILEHSTRLSPCGSCENLAQWDRAVAPVPAGKGNRNMVVDGLDGHLVCNAALI